MNVAYLIARREMARVTVRSAVVHESRFTVWDDSAPAASITAPISTF
jgi:hypothetical protein